MSQANRQSSPAAGDATSLTIAVVGDVHDLWDEGDGTALQHLGVDLVLFVG
ncbi:MAG: TIGR04168 family protein, partial [Cyanobacteria bacterium P01_A01_bin.135]